ncbi:hypothetical protein AGLY_013564 [Aphis glycines]|uniref:Uncharacterized protein n=1 Tax=Aphis glycines TaxID=307491 RepID=A0A6G0T7A6_APHGL|nr:hypothetical protein AGLY_013564 [Aphis glycines]
MQSFLFKTICCILIINATFCSGCSRSLCNARCYYKNNGFDFGYCEKRICKCAPPVIYVFDGIDRSLRDDYRDNSLDNNDVIQNLIPKSSTSASNILDKNKIWKDILGKIIYKNPFIKEETLKDLKAKIFNDLSHLNNFSIDLQNSLETVLDEMEKKMPSVSKECGPMINETQNPPLLQATMPSSQAAQAPPQIVPSLLATPKKVNKLTESLPRSTVPNRNGIANTLPSTTKTGANPDNQKSSNPNSNSPQSKSKTNQNTNEQDTLNSEMLLELSEETVEYDDSEEQTDENIKKNNFEKPQTPDNNKTGGKLPPVKKENRDDDDSYEYESGSGSGSYETVEEKDEPVAAYAAVGTSNK